MTCDLDADHDNNNSQEDETTGRYFKTNLDKITEYRLDILNEYKGLIHSYKIEGILFMKNIKYTNCTNCYSIMNVLFIFKKYYKSLSLIPKYKKVIETYANKMYYYYNHLYTVKHDDLKNYNCTCGFYYKIHPDRENKDKINKDSYRFNTGGEYMFYYLEKYLHLYNDNKD